MRALIIAFGLLSGGCAEAISEPDAAALDVPDAVEIVDTPTTREEFLAELLPLPKGPISIDYAVQGPGGIDGTMRVVMAEGGRRRETWSLQMPMPAGDTVAIKGSTIVTPDHTWTDAAEGSATIRARSLGKLADAYLQADDDTQRAITKNVRTWHHEIEQGRRAHPGAQDTMLGQSCLRSRVAGQSLCVWEAAGLPLEYRSETFSLQATQIHTAFALPSDAFDVPEGAQVTASARDFDPTGALARVADGDLAQIIAVLQPSLRLPDPS